MLEVVGRTSTRGEANDNLVVILAFDDSNRTLPGTPTESSGQVSLRCWLEYHGQTIELRPGVVQVGRSSTCHVILDDALVSRRHAQFVVSQQGATLEDLGSVNGVFLNARRLKRTEKLKNGDRVQIGKAEFVFRVADPSDRPRHERFAAETLHNLEVPPELLRRMRAGADPDSAPELDAPETVPPDAVAPATAAPPAQSSLLNSDGPHDEPTREGDVIEVLGMVADKALGFGRGEEAERIMSKAMNKLLSEALLGRTLNPRSAERAVAYAVKLAEATGRARWVDYCFELYGALKKPLPGPVVDHLYTAVRKVSGMSLVALRAYLTTLQALAPHFGPSDRFLLQRLEGLERVAAR